MLGKMGEWGWVWWGRWGNRGRGRVVRIGVMREWGMKLDLLG